MRVLITGGAGFLGTRLAHAILKRGTLTDAAGNLREVSQLTLLDQFAPQVAFTHPLVRSVTGDVADAGVLSAAMGDDTASVFHLAAVVSGQAEAEFDLGMRVNFDATRALLEACRAQKTIPKFVFTSSIAVFGGALPAVLPDDQRVTPQGSYGAQKAMGELLVSDMSRKGFVDGRVLRLPTVTVRPGKPNAAASSFASGMIREPMAGVTANVPVSPETKMWVQSPARVIDNLMMSHEIPAAQLPAFSRTINVPGISVSVREMAESLRRVAGDEVADRLTWHPDPAIERIVNTWPQAFEAKLGLSLGMNADTNFDEIVRAHQQSMN